MACRLPGANSPGAFWRNLCAGVESIHFFTEDELVEAGVDRSTLANPRYVRAAPVLDGVAEFDAGFFGYTPREAALLDPQQRLFLEVAWESFEDAGYDPQLHDEVVGVFAGAGGVVTSYLAGHGGHPGLEAQTGSLEHISNDKDFLATRVSYELNLTGPSLTVQTACSTSLVAVHLACQSLLAGECDMALAGASTVRVPHLRGYLAEEGSIYSKDGHCRSFDAAGSGTIFGSGVAAVLLKPLAAALADGDPIRAVIRGTAINNDGSRKASYTAPSVFGEARAMIEALQVARVSPDTVGYVECHATGTVVGDPLEIRALTRAFQVQTQRRGFCAVGSAKTNIGHAEQTAGLAGLIKTALILQHGVIPPTLHLHEPNPEIRFEETPFYVPTSLTPWPANEEGAPRRAAVNSLGIGGTNAFAVLEEAPRPRRATDAPDPGGLLLCVSAKSDAALDVRVAQAREALLAAPAEDAGDMCFSINASRSGLSHRAVFQGSDREQLAASLAAFSAERGRAIVRNDLPPVAFLLSGQGSQYPGMGRDLFRASPVFRDAIETCDALFRGQLGESLIELLTETGPDVEQRLAQTICTQPAVFAVDWAVAEVWRSWGLQPAAVIGHSLGELAAACVAGAVALPDAFRFVVERAGLMQSIDRSGAMLAVMADEAAVRALLVEASAEVEIACLNGPRNTVLSGPLGAIEEIAGRCAERKLPSQRLPVSHAFHSAMMEPILHRLGALEASLDWAAPEVPLVSNVTGDVLEQVPAGYWRAHARGTVRFADGMATLRRLGVTTFVEVGPGGALLALGRQSLPDVGGAWVASLDRRRDGWSSLLRALGDLYQVGFRPDWRAVEPVPRRRLPLPTYPFERKRHWLDSASRVAAARAAALPAPLTVTPDVPFDLGPEVRRLLGDHQICGWTIMPTAAIAAQAIAAGKDWLGTGQVTLEGLRYHRPLMLEDGSTLPMKLVGDRRADGVTVQLLAEGPDRGWHQHASGKLVTASGGADDREEHLVGPPRGPGWRKVSGERFYTDLRRRGFGYGPAFRNVAVAWKADGQVRGRVQAPRGMDPVLRAIPLVDACLHLFPLLFEPAADLEAAVFLPTGAERVRLLRTDATRAWADVRLRDVGADGQSATVDVTAVDDRGRAIARISGLGLRLIPRRNLQQEGTPLLRRHLYSYAWEPREADAVGALAADRRAWVLFSDREGVAAALAESLRRAGHHCHVAFDPEQPRAYRALLEKIAATEDLPFAGLVYAAALDVGAGRGFDADRLEAVESSALRGPLHAAQALTALPAFSEARLWIVTRNAQATSVGCDIAIGQAPVVGFGRTFALEHPRQWGATLDLPGGGSSIEDDAAALAKELLAPDGEGQIALRDGVRLVPRLVRRLDGPADGPLRYRADATYLITGGLGMIGLRTARWLVETRGVRHLALTSRSQPHAEAQREIAELRRMGAKVRVLRGDVGKRDDVRRIVAAIDRRGPALKGIVHCAGALADGVIAQQTWSRFREGTAAKIRGAWLLHELTRSHGLEVFVLHSSLLSLTGSIAQANYTAGNAFLDALCDHRRAEGLPAMVINWGPWAEAGMANDRGAGGEQLWRRLGTEMIPAATGLQVLDYLHELGASHAALTICDWNVYAKRTPGAGRLFERLVAGDAEPAVAATQGPGRDVLTELRHLVTAELGFDEPVDVDQPLGELGLDSLMAVNLVNRIEARLDVRLPLVKVIEGPSVRELAGGLGAARPAPTEKPTPPAPRAKVAPRSPWLVVPRPNPSASVRLVCFPFAGGGAATFRPWAESLAPSIELVAVEPPGRATRIAEPPVKTMAAFLRGVLPDVLALRDKPLALFGHCQGALYLVEVARRLARRRGVDLAHIFLSGCRPPAMLKDTDLFEENLLRQLVAHADYDPLLSLSAQPDPAFGLALRQFDIGRTGEFLSKPELRRLLLPAIRADFELADRYDPPENVVWDVPITYFSAVRDPYVTRNQALGWSAHTTRAFKIHFRPGAHFTVSEDRDFIVATINGELGATPAPSRRLPLGNLSLEPWAHEEN
jgi:acyl transferase domain-containing protein/surfactin synthase thioesterase subunit/acyl carrier protein